MREVDKAVKLLRSLFNGLAEDRNETVEVYAEKHYERRNGKQNNQICNAENRNKKSFYIGWYDTRI